jgi:hypothetical protein
MFIMGDRPHGEVRPDDSSGQLHQQSRGSRDQDTKYLEDIETQLHKATLLCMGAIANYLGVGDRHQHHVMHMLLRLLLEHFSPEYKSHIARVDTRHFYAILTHFISQINILDEQINDVVIEIVSRCLIAFPHQAYWLTMSMFDDSLQVISTPQGQTSSLSPDSSMDGETKEQRCERERFERSVCRIRDIVHCAFIGISQGRKKVDSKMSVSSSSKHPSNQQQRGIPGGLVPPLPPSLPGIRPIKQTGGLTFAGLVAAAKLPLPLNQCVRIEGITHPWTVAHTARNVINQLCGGKRISFFFFIL